MGISRNWAIAHLWPFMVGFRSVMTLSVGGCHLVWHCVTIILYEAQGLVEVSSSTLLALFGSDQFMLCLLAMSFFQRFPPVSLKKSESQSYSVMSDSLWPHGLYNPWNSPGQSIGVGSLSLLQGIFPTQGSYPGFPYCRRILYQLSQKGSPRILEWVAYPFSSRSSLPRNWTRVSWIAGGFFINWAIREAL